MLVFSLQRRVCCVYVSHLRPWQLIVVKNVLTNGFMAKQQTRLVPQTCQLIVFEIAASANW